MDNEELLLKKASKRAGFKVHITIFILANLFFWLFWFFVLKGFDIEKALFKGVLFISLVWLIFAIGHYLFVYKWNKTLVEKELMRLKNEIKKQEEEIERLKNEMEENNQEMKI